MSWFKSKSKTVTDTETSEYPPVTRKMLLEREILDSLDRNAPTADYPIFMPKRRDNTPAQVKILADIMEEV